VIPKIEQEDGYWYVSVNGERLGKFSSRTGAWISADGLARQAFKKGWNAAIEARRKRLSMSHDGS
jgi:hypothetical protein